jgi:ELWxxDGT repeat protein
MRILLCVVALAFIAATNGCSSSSSAQSGPILQPVVASGEGIAFVTANEAGNSLFWLYSDATGWEPWFHDGESPAVSLEIVPGATGSACDRLLSSAQIVTAGPYFYFWADDAIDGCEVWRTDGTPEGTELFTDAIPGGAGFLLAGDLAIGGNNLYMAGRVSEGIEIVEELYVVNLE